MDLSLAGRAVIVTGGASGIGAACVATLAGEGARVGVLDRDARGAQVAGLTPGAFRHVDVTDEPALSDAVDAVVAALGGAGLDAVICCAGVSGPVGTPAWEIEENAWDNVMAVNAKGPFLVAKHTRRHLVAGADGARAIVLVASDSAVVAAPGMTPYCASKGAVQMLTRALSVDLAGDQIRVNCVCPSIVDTPMSREDLGRPEGFADAPFPVVDAHEVARHVTYLASPAAASINGTSLIIDHGYLARSGFPA